MEIYNKLFKILKHDDLILTPNKRLLSFLQKSYAAYQQTQKKMVWPTLLILPLEIWITLQWEKQLIQKNSIYPYRLLTKNQEHLIWQSIIEKSGTYFLMLDQIAKTVQQAWQLNHLCQLDYTSSQFAQTNESHIWKSWANSFMAFCQEHSCIDMSRATNLLINLFRKKKLKPPQQLFLIGFDEITPQIKKLLQILEQSGCEISQFSIFEPKPWIGRLVLANTETELQTMARWAYQSWHAGKKNIVCAIPNLLTIRPQVIATFTEVFTTLNLIPMETYPFNIAGGEKLNEFPMIQTALAIIQLKTIIPFNKISRLLRSPYLGYAEEEQSNRAQLDIYSRRYLENTLDLKQLVQLSQQQNCPKLSQLLEQFISIVYPTMIKQLPSQWAIYFSQKLQALAWPGQRQLLSEEFQLIERWSALLEELSTLDFILGEISEEVAWQQLNYLTHETLFQAKTEHAPPIHVLGLLDTAGLCVDSLWIMGLDDKSWPATAQPNPFIPYALQRKQALPHSSNERELYFATLITQRLLKSARTIVLSHSTQTQQSEQPLRPSALIAAIPCIEINELELPSYQTIIETIWLTRSWEYYNDDLAPPFQSHELASIGSQLFKSQAACPFQAFAQFRLKSYFYPFPTAGLNPIDRGILLHDALETLWNALTDQTTLLKQTEPLLQILIKQSVTHAIAKFSKKRPYTFKRQFRTIEEKRLQQRLTKLLVLEKQRRCFHNVIHEKKLKFTFENLPLNLRIDRIDTLSDGSLLIIDYKTGTPIKFNWFEERLEEPQLALYCLSQPCAKGFAVIHIRSERIEIQGFSEKENGLSQLISFKKDKSLPQNWSELLLFWKTALEKLAQEFQAGLAKVDPKQGTHTCRLCRLPLFCRVNHHEKST